MAEAENIINEAEESASLLFTSLQLKVLDLDAVRIYHPKLTLTSTLSSDKKNKKKFTYEYDEAKSSVDCHVFQLGKNSELEGAVFDQFSFDQDGFHIDIANMDDIGAHSESSGEGVLAGELLWRERPKIQRGGKLARARSGKKAQEKMEKKAQEENKIISVPVEGDGLPPGAVQLVLGYQIRAVPKAKVVVVDESEKKDQDSAAGRKPNLLKVIVWKAEEIIPVDKNGSEMSSDPYVKLSYGGKTFDTKKLDKTVNPVWNQMYHFILDCDRILPLEFEVKDQRLLGANPVLGRCTLSANQVEIAVQTSFAAGSKAVLMEQQLEKVKRTGLMSKLGTPTAGADRLSAGSLSVQIVAECTGESAEELDGSFRNKYGPLQGTSDLTAVALADGKHGDGGDGCSSDEEDGGGGEEETKELTPEEQEAERKKEEEEREKAKKEMEEKQKIIEKYPVRDGDYTVMIHLIEVRDLIAKDADGAADPQVKLEVFGQAQYSPIRRNTDSAAYDLHYFFKLKSMDIDDLESGSVKVSVYDTKSRLGMQRQGPLLGHWATDFSFLYYREGHEMYRTWVGLIDDGENPSVAGYAKLSISFLGPGERPVVHDRALEKQKEDEERKKHPDAAGGGGGVGGLGLAVQMSVKAQTQKFVVLTVHRAKGLAPLDREMLGLGKANKLDAYVQIFYGDGGEQKTDVRRNLVAGGDGRCACEWNQELWLPVMWPPFSSQLSLRVMDADPVNDELVGKCETVQLAYLEKYPGLFRGVWFNLYGAPLAGLTPADELAKKDAIEEANTDTRTASTYRGKVLLSLRIDDGKLAGRSGKKKMKAFKVHSKPVNPAAVQAVAARLEKYCLRALVFAGSELPQEGGGILRQFVRVKVTIGTVEIATVKLHNRDGMVYWEGQVQEAQLDLPEPGRAREIPDVIIYLESEGKNVCYKRLRATDLIDKGFGADPQWYHFDEDPVFNIMGAAKGGGGAGSVLMRLGFGTLAAAQAGPQWGGLTDFPPLEKYTAVVHIFQAQNLPPADASGLCDPYVKVKFAGKTKQTKFKKQTRNPHYYESLSFQLDLPGDRDVMPMFLVELWDWDWDSAFGGDDFLGAVRQPASKAFVADAGAPATLDQLKPKWYPLAKQEEGDTQGSVLLAFELIKGDLPKFEPIDLHPPTVTRYLEITCLGGRGLKSPDMLPLQKPFIEFALNSCAKGQDQMKSAGGRRGVQAEHATLPSCKPSPQDPTYEIQRVVIPVALPLDPLFAPSLNVTVRDRRFGGLVTPIVGTTFIPLHNRIRKGKDGKKNPLFKKGIKLQDDNPNLDASPADMAGDGEGGGDAVPGLLKLLTAGGGGAEETKTGGGGGGGSGSGRVSPNPTGGRPGGGSASKAREVSSRRSSTSSAGNGAPDAADTLAELHGAPEQRAQQRTASEKRAERAAAHGAFDLTRGASTREKGQAKVVEQQEDVLEDGLLSAGVAAVGGAIKGGVNADLMGLMGLPSAQDQPEPGYQTSLGPQLGVEAYMQDRDTVLRQLEDEFDLGAPFETFPVFRTGKLFGDAGATVVAGLVKAVVRVLDDADEPEPKVITMVKQRAPVQVRLYVLKGQGLYPMDDGTHSDPYLKVRLGDKEINKREEYIADTLEPKFFQVFEFVTKLPGVSQLEVECWDHDLLFDDLIGSTTVDLEDRWYSLKWRDLGKVYEQLEDGTYNLTGIKKPVEHRSLWRPCSQQPQGDIKMWLDIFEVKDAKKYPLLKIAPPPRAKFQLRLVVWSCRNIPNGDPETAMSDMFCRAWVGSGHHMETDVHWRATGGKGNFNWRMCIEVELPLETEGANLFHFQVWDKDIFGDSDCIASQLLNFETIFKNALLLDKPYTVFRKPEEAAAAPKPPSAQVMPERQPSPGGAYGAAAAAAGAGGGAQPGGASPKSSTEKTSLLATAPKPKKKPAGRFFNKKKMSEEQIREQRKLNKDLRKEKKKKNKKPKTMWDTFRGAVGLGPMPDDSAWITLEATAEYKDQVLKDKDPQVCLSLEILPERYAAAMPVGAGRGEPNTLPYLPEPEGRPDLTKMWNPFYLLKTCLGAELFMKLCVPLVCCSFLLVTIFGGPYIFELMDLLDIFPSNVQLIILCVLLGLCLFGGYFSYRSCHDTCCKTGEKKNKTPRNAREDSSTSDIA